MASKMKNKEIAWWVEDSRVAAELLRLRVHMRLLKRPMRVLGGSAKLWGGRSKWDQLVEKCVAIARAHGIPTTTGRKLRLTARSVC
jgi:hypothetical protein